MCVKGFSGRGSRNRHKNVDSKHSKKQLCINVTLCLIVTELCNKCLSIWNRELLNELSKQTNILHNMTQQVYIVYIKHDSTASSKLQVPQKINTQYFHFANMQPYISYHHHRQVRHQKDSPEKIHHQGQNGP